MFRKKKTPLFGTEIEPDCRYCAYGPGPVEACPRRNPDMEDTESACRAFRYDPLMRAPQAPPPLKSHDPSEFEL